MPIAASTADDADGVVSSDAAALGTAGGLFLVAMLLANRPSRARLKT
jgi:hypothetical protein